MYLKKGGNPIYAHVLRDFLTGRKMQVRVGNTYSSWRDQELGGAAGLRARPAVLAARLRGHH